MPENSIEPAETSKQEQKRSYTALTWILAGALYGLLLRVFFGIAPHYFAVDGVMSAAFLVATPIVVGAITVYGRRHVDRSISYMLMGPWATIALMMLGCAVTLLEGSICIALMAPMFLLCGSLGGVIMGLLLNFWELRDTHVGAIAVLPFLMMIAESFAPLVNAETEIRNSVVIDASRQRVWEEIMNAESIQPDELPFSVSHLIGVPKPVEGVNRVTPEGEIRYSRWERGVRFEAIVSRREQYETVRWHYAFDAHSFPEGSMDEHVEIGGKFFGLQDTTFNLRSLPNNQTELELIANYRVSSSINFYAVPAAKLLGRDFVNTILGLYKHRSEAQSAGIPATL